MEENFTNTQIESYSLPSVTNVDFQGLERDYFKVGLIGVLIFSSVLIIGSSLIRLSGVLDPYSDYIYIPVLILIGLYLFFLIKGFKHKAYALRQHDILYKRGYIWRSQTVIPFNRVQHCEVDQGPLERLFDISSLKVFTAGGSSSDLSIPGLRLETAQSLKDLIMRKIPSDEEE